MDRRLFVPWTLLTLLFMAPLALSMRTSERRGSAWMDKLKPKLHSRANRTTLPNVPRVWRDRFELVKKLGQGGFGAVYQMKVTCDSGSWWSYSSPNAPNFVSAKLVSRADGSLKTEVERMKQHFSEYVVSTIGVPDTARSPVGEWVMMPFLNGGSLKDLIAKCSDNDGCRCDLHSCPCQGRMQPWACWEEVGLSLPYVLALFDEVLEGLESIHNTGLAHMDMKPDNIMLQCSGPACYALVIDLGTLCDKNIAKKKISGTPGYMAPEVYPPTLHAGIPSNDVWAMGVTLFQLLYMAYPDYTSMWGANIKDLLKYQPEKDPNMPKERTNLDQLVVDMLNVNHTTRISLPEARQRLRCIIELQEPKQEVLDMIHKTPAERGLSNTLPDCINVPTEEETRAEEDEEEQEEVDLLAAGGARPGAKGDSVDDEVCRGKPWNAEGWFKCGVCNGLLCQRCCGCMVHHEGQIKEKYYRAKSCVRH